MSRPKKVVVGLYIIAVILVLVFTVAATVNSEDETAKSGQNELIIDTSKDVSLGQCQICHPDIDDIENPKLIFKHDAHLKIGVACKKCHTQFPHTPDGNIVIPMDLCFSCHGINHGPQGSMAPGDCELCHPKGMELEPVNHTLQFKDKEHNDKAAKNLFNCKTCHKIDFCQECHTIKDVIPKDHKDKKVWEIEHGPLSQNIDNCNICHSDDFCVSCHETDIPHNIFWLKTHNTIAKKEQESCTKCHNKETYCQDCHHAGTKDQLLTLEVCKCHSEKMEGKVSEIKEASMAVHKSHFDMTRTKPFPCWKCHTEGKNLEHDDNTFRVCYKCHGQYESGALIAKYPEDELCYQCHSKVFVEELKKQGSQSFLVGHKMTQPEFQQRCLLCHSVGYCNSCHAEKRVKSSVISDLKIQLKYKKITSEYIAPTETKKVQTDKIQLGGVVTMGRCQSCHPNIDDFQNPILIFPHEAHLKRGMVCAACHQKYPHINGENPVPTMDFCYSCHGLEHSDKGKVASEKCELCHPKGMDQQPDNHNSKFKNKEHGDAADKNLFNCKTCHQVEFCQQCHNQRQVLPEDHKESGTWRREHGKQPQGTDDCNICHTQSFCNNCHGTQVPHNIFWLKAHNTEAKKDRFSCEQCHRDEAYCQDCHHSETQNQKLTRQACKCHADQMKGDIKEIKNRGMAVHRAHFDMTQTEPFDCWKCHIEGVQLEHNVQSFNLCYKCHGRYRAGKLIAKWPGTELCYRCHPPK